MSSRDFWARIASEFFAAQYLPAFADEDQIIQTEITAEQYQKNGHSVLGKGMEQFHTAGNESESAGPCAPKGCKISISFCR